MSACGDYINALPEPDLSPYPYTGKLRTYNLREPQDANEYLEIEIGRELHPIRNQEELIRAMDLEPRAALFLDGTRQSLAHHVVSLRATCEDIADLYPGFVKPLLSDTTVWHDAPEVKGGDTEVGDEMAAATREPREVAGLTSLAHDLGEGHRGIKIARRYERNPHAILEFMVPKTFDKTDHTDFQIDNNALLFRLRRDELRAVVRYTFDGTVVLDVPFKRAIKAALHLAYIWRECVDEEFNGDPAKLVLEERDEALVRLARQGRRQYILTELLKERTRRDRDQLLRFFDY